MTNSTPTYVMQWRLPGGKTMTWRFTSPRWMKHRRQMLLKAKALFILTWIAQ